MPKYFSLRTIIIASLVAWVISSMVTNGFGQVAASPAKIRYDVAVAKAEEAYKQSLIAAKKAYIGDLVVQVKVAMTGGNLEAANTTNAEKAKIEKELADLVPATSTPAVMSKVLTFLVPANSSGIEVFPVKAGDVIYAAAEGQWTVSPAFKMTGPDGYKDKPDGRLIGVVGTDKYLIGSRATITIKTDGLLQLKVLDGNESYGDNSGAVSVQIRRKAGGA